VVKNDFSPIISPCVEWLYSQANIKYDQASNDQSLVQFSSFLKEGRKISEFFLSNLVDKFLASDIFTSAIHSPLLKITSADLLECSKEHVVISHPFFRLDMPQEFKEDEARLLLPWHQEYGYYQSLGNCSPNSLVISIPLFECRKINGCLIAGPKSYLAGLLPHQEFYFNPEKKKHYRVRCDGPKQFVACETNFGEAQVIHFLTVHKSGVNASNLARCVLLARISNKKDPNFLPKQK
jgi:hypothetical protein